MLELIFLEGGQLGHTIRLNFDRAWFGRQPTCDFVLQGEGIGRVHFSIERRGDDYVLVDNRSTNGTFVNSVRTEHATLHAGDDIVAGTNRMQVREVSPNARHTFRFIAQQGVGEGGSQIVEQETVLLGRKNICPIQLNDPAVAAVHAELEHRADGLWITDQSSGAGVYVNGQRVVSQQLHEGDVVTIRPFEMTISLTEEMCFLGIQDRTVEMEMAPKQIPGHYKDVVVAPQREAGQAKPSAAIAALPRWLQAKAPIWVPTSDILPNRFRAVMLLIFVLGVLGWTAIAFAKKWNSAYSPGASDRGHSAFACASCHSSFASCLKRELPKLSRGQSGYCNSPTEENRLRGVPLRAPGSEVRHRAECRRRMPVGGVPRHRSHRSKAHPRAAGRSGAGPQGSASGCSRGPF